MSTPPLLYLLSPTTFVNPPPGPIRIQSIRIHFTKPTIYFFLEMSRNVLKLGFIANNQKTNIFISKQFKSQIMCTLSVIIKSTPKLKKKTFLEQ